MRYYCGECDHIETDEIFLDVEICSICGASITAADFDDGQPTEQQEWADYDIDC